jgi:hypothetical protein
MDNLFHAFRAAYVVPSRCVYLFVVFIFHAGYQENWKMGVKISPSDKSTRSSVCLVSLLIVVSLSLNFFPKSVACPMTYAGRRISMRVCDCCSKCRQSPGHVTMPATCPGMCRDSGVCHITDCAHSTSGTRGANLTYLAQQPFDGMLASGAGPFSGHELPVALSLLDGKNTPPPEAS